MISMHASEIASLVGGRLVGRDIEFSGSVVIDSREATPGSLFAALPGEHVDGHDYVLAAAKQGAVLAFVVRDVNSDQITSIVVPDVAIALFQLASEVRKRLTNVTVVGITGSQGKTTTKDMVLQVLSNFGETVAPKESFNNEIGLPLTILKCNEATRYLVLELGATHIGDIAKLAAIAKIDVAIVLVVGNAHLGEFGSVENIARAKGELVEALGPEGYAVLGTYDSFTPEMSLRAPGRVITFGPSGLVRAERLSLVDGEPLFVVAGREIHLHFTGAHQVANAEAVLAACQVLDLDMARVAHALSAARPLSKWRMERSLTPLGALLLNDCYNANPASMSAALNTLAEIATGRTGRSIALLGEMRELGESSHVAHENIGRLVAELMISRFAGIGEAGETMVRAAIAAGHRDAQAFADHNAALIFVETDLQSNDVILVKASRGTHLEGLAQRLAQGANP